jgi:hypothetical protein
MTLPLDVPTVTLTYGAHINAGKEPLKSGTLIVVPQLARTHLASGTYVDRSAVKTDLAGGVATSEPVVASDATGFNVDGLTLYTIRFEGLIAADGSLLDRPALINVALPASVPVVDVDMLASAESQSGAIINYPSVIGIAGLSGDVSAADLFAAIEDSVTAKVQEGVATSNLFQPAITILPFGNSVAAQCLDDVQAATNLALSRYSPTDWANIYAQGRLSIVGNKGIGGQRTSQFLARFDADVLPSAADWVLLPSPLTNDLFDGTGVTVAQMKANMAELYDRIIASGRKVIETLTGPSGYGTATTLSNLYEMQRWQREYVKGNPSIVLVDGHQPVADPADGWPLSGYCRPGDSSTGDHNRGVHPGYLWASKLGRKIAEGLEPFYARIPVLEAPSNVDARNILPNGRMLGNTSGMATGYTFVKTADGTTATGTPSKVARTDGQPGEVQQFLVPQDTWAAEKPNLFIQDITPSGRWNVGDTVRLVVHFETDPDTAGSYPAAPGITFWNLGLAVLGLGFSSSDGSQTPAVPAGVDALPRKGTWRTPWAVVPASTGRLQVRVPLPWGTTRILSTEIQKAA